MGCLRSGCTPRSTAGSGTDHGNGPGSKPAACSTTRLSVASSVSSSPSARIHSWYRLRWQDVVPDDPDGSIGFHDVQFRGGGVHPVCTTVDDPGVPERAVSRRLEDRGRQPGPGLGGAVRAWPETMPPLGATIVTFPQPREADRRQDSGVSHPRITIFAGIRSSTAAAATSVRLRFGMGVFVGSSGAGLQGRFAVQTGPWP